MRMPQLRLVGSRALDVPVPSTLGGSAGTLGRPTPQVAPPKRRPATPGQPITDPADPRWVLALRAAEALQGAILVPERRERLLRMGRLMGLSLFDANLIIAMIQDQARRGCLPAYCPQAARSQLALVPPPRESRWGSWWRSHRRWCTVVSLAVLAAGEVAALWWMLR